jgi:anionic cell wall polymer biosynthesis LytR-Cps2A-Psr (LCP) family protein
MLFTVDVFPLKYTAIVMGVVFVLFLITYLTQKKRKLHVLGKIWGILVSIVLAIGVLVLVGVNMAFDSVVGGGEKKNNVVMSVTQDVFHVLVDEDGEYRLATVNPEKHQILMTNIPADYFVAIPGVSEGKRDTLKNAENYGMEAVMAAVGSLFETEVPFYAKINLAGLQETLKTFTPDMEVSLEDLTGTVGDNIETNLSKRQVQQLVKLYLGEDAEWEILSNDTEGRNSSNYTYSDPDKVSFVMEPDKDSVAKAMDLIKRMEDGEKLKASDVAE